MASNEIILIDNKFRNVKKSLQQHNGPKMAFFSALCGCFDHGTCIKCTMLYITGKLIF